MEGGSTAAPAQPAAAPQRHDPWDVDSFVQPELPRVGPPRLELFRWWILARLGVRGQRGWVVATVLLAVVVGWLAAHA